MNELHIFTNPEFGRIRALTIDGEPWTVGRDVAAALGYRNTKDALATHVDAEDRQVIQRSKIATLTNYLPKSAFPFDFVSADIPNRGLTFINESGLYSLILSSKLPAAKRFKRWITSEVLPAIREMGMYANPRIVDEPIGIPKATRELTTDDYTEAARIISRCGVKNMDTVLHLLWLAGFDIPDVQKAEERRFRERKPVERDTIGEAAGMINAAMEKYGMTLRAVAKIVGLQPTQVNRIRMGESNPTMERSRTICDALQNALGGVVC